MNVKRSNDHSLLISERAKSRGYFCHISDSESLISLYVEAAATGTGHNDRAPCRLAAVNIFGQALLDVVIYIPPHRLRDPLSDITGLSATDIHRGIAFQEARSRLVSICGPNTVLIAQNPENGIEWMELKQTIDYKRAINIANYFRVWNYPSHWCYFTLAKTAYGLLNMEIQREIHSPVEDSRAAMQLFLKYLIVHPENTEDKLLDARGKLFGMQLGSKFPEWLMKKPTVGQGICHSKYDLMYCCCGQPTGRMVVSSTMEAILYERVSFHVQYA